MDARATSSRSGPSSVRALNALGGLAGSFEQRYVIERKIASGGMANIYLGRRVGAGAGEPSVAIKVCHPHLLESEHRTEALLDEARIASRIHHPNVVATLDVVAHDGSVMIVMEYVEGLTVAGLVRAAGRADRPIPVDIALRIIVDGLGGLHAAHELADEEGRPLGVVHRDVSPQNILVGTDGLAKLADFGVSKGEERLAPTTVTGELKGKLGYVAPEVYRGEVVTRRADIYAMGIVLWEALAGRRLFDEPTHAGMMQRVLGGKVPAVAALRDDVPAEIDAVLARALALDPRDRYGTAEDLANAIVRVSGTVAGLAALAPIATTRAVGDHVRDAMRVLGVSALAAPPASSGMLPSAPEERTPGEYVTRVDAPARRRRMPAITLVALGGVLAALAGGVVILRSPASRSATEVVAPPPPQVATSSAVAVTPPDPLLQPPKSPPVVGSPPVGATHASSPSVADGRSLTPPPGKPASAGLPRPRRGSPGTAPSSSAPPAGGRAVYDPKEL